MKYQPGTIVKSLFPVNLDGTSISQGNELFECIRYAGDQVVIVSISDPKHKVHCPQIQTLDSYFEIVASDPPQVTTHNPLPPESKLPPLLPNHNQQLLDKYFKNMPTIYSEALIKRPGYSSIIKLYDTAGKAFQSQPTCDCGGFKTYNTMSPEAHSSWCSSRSKV